MRRLLTFVVLLASVCTVYGQSSGVRSVSTLPAVCSPGGGAGGAAADHVDLWNGSTNLPYYCDSLNHWTQIGAGGGAGNPGGSNTQIQINNSGTAFGAINNAAPGSVLASQGMASIPAFQTKQLYDIRDFGCVGDGIADDTACVNAWLAKASTTAALYCKSGVYLLPNGITFTGSLSQALYILGEAGSASGGGQGCVFQGGASSGAIIHFIGLNSSTIQNIGFNSTTAKYGFWFDASNDTGGLPSANVHLIDIHAGGGVGAGSCAIALGHAGSTSVEVAGYTFDNVSLVGGASSVYGVCALVGGNTKDFTFNEGSAVGFQYGYYFNAGAGNLAFIGQANASNTVTDYQLTSSSVSIISNDSEGSNSFVKGTAFGTLTLMNNQIEEVSTDATDVMVSWAGMLDMRNNSCRNARTGSSLCKVVAPNPLNSATTTAASSVLSQNNCYANSTLSAPIYDGSGNPLAVADPSSYAGQHVLAVESISDRGGDCGTIFGPTLKDVHQGGGQYRLDGVTFTENTAPASATGQDLLWGDSTAHRVKMNNNNGTATSVAGFTDNLGVFAVGGSIAPASIIDSGISASTSPLCPNGSGGAFTTVGCTVGATPSFSVLTSGTNNTAAMVVGNGASLGFIGTGTLTSSGTVDFTNAIITKLRVGTGAFTSVNGDVGYDSTNANWHFWNGADSIMAPLAVGFVSGHCPQPTLVSGQWVFADTGSACGTGGGGGSITGLVAGQVGIAGSSTSLTSSKALAGSGAGITTGPASGVVSGDVPKFTGTGGQIADGYVLAGAGAGLTTGPITSTTGDLPDFTGTAGQIADSSIASANVVTAAANYTSGNVVQAAASDKTTSDSGVATANLVTAAAAYTSGDLVKAAASNKTTSDAGIAAANVVTAAANYTSGDLVGAAASNKTTSDSGIAIANVVTAATNFTVNHIPIAAGSNKTLQDGFPVQGTDASLLSVGTVSGTGNGLCLDTNNGATTSGCVFGGVLSGLVTNNILYATSPTAAGSVGGSTIVTGQIPVFQHAAAPIAASPGVADSSSSPVTSASYTIQCDSSTTIIDRAHTIRFQSGASTPVVPLSSASGCVNLATIVMDDGAGSLVFGRTSPDTFTVCNGTTCSDSQTSFTLTNGQYASLNQAASGLWEVRIVAGGGGGGGGTVSVVSSGTLGSTQLTTGGGTTLVQTPCATCTLASSGIASFTPGSALGGTTANFSILGFLNDSNTAPVLNIDTPVGTSGAQQGAVRFGTNGFSQFQVCNFGTGGAAFGANIFGSTVACGSINTANVAKNVFMTGTATHTLIRGWQGSAAATADMIQLNNATASGTGYNFITAYSGVTGTDTFHTGGTKVFGVDGAGDGTFLGTLAVTGHVTLEGVTSTGAAGTGNLVFSSYVDGHYIANGTATMGTGAVTSGTCATVVTVSATGVATTDVITSTPNTDPTVVTGYAPSSSGSLYIQAYPTANNVSFKVCNDSAGTITPAALTLNWKVVR